jgi:hypothetical protein
MTNAHLREEEIQQYALSSENGGPAATAHLNSCAVCQAALDSYRLLFSGLTQQPPAVFHFDLPATIMTRLPQHPSGLSAERIVGGFLVIFSAGCLFFPLYYFRKMLTSLFTDIPPFFLIAIGISTSFILVIKIISLYKKYLNQLRLLNFN